MTSPAKGRRETGFLWLLHGVARIALVAGAVGSVGLMLGEGRHTPRVLLALFVLWVLSPFGVLAWADTASPRWSVTTRATLYGVMLVITLGSLAMYGHLIRSPVGSAHAAVFVAVPPASWLLTAIVLSLAALQSRRRSSDASS